MIKGVRSQIPKLLVEQLGRDLDITEIQATLTENHLGGGDKDKRQQNALHIPCPSCARDGEKLAYLEIAGSLGPQCYGREVYAAECGGGPPEPLSKDAMDLAFGRMKPGRPPCDWIGIVLALPGDPYGEMSVAHPGWYAVDVNHLKEVDHV